MENNEELKTLEDQKPAEPTIEELKKMIIELVKLHPDFESGRLSRCHLYKCPLAWMWLVWYFIFFLYIILSYRLGLICNFFTL